MSFFTNRIEAVLLPVMNKISSQRHLKAVSSALIATIPLTVLGAMFLLVPYIPWPESYVQYWANNPELVSKVLIPFNMTLGLLSVYVSFAIGYYLAESYEMDRIGGGFAATLGFVVTMKFASIEGGSYFPTAYLGGEGMFTAILTSIFAIEVMRLCKKYNLAIKLPSQVPANVSSGFESLVPITISTAILWVIVHFIGFDINQIIGTVVTPLLSASADSIVLPLAYVILTAVMWFCGIHPAILAAICSPIWLTNEAANMAAIAAGNTAVHVGVRPFIFTFLWIGGGGGTLTLCILMCLSKSKTLKSLGRLSIVPGLFNINEPILFGLPIVFNPYFVIPLIVGPIVCTIITYLAFTTGIVPGIGYPAAAVWTLPSLFAGVICTGSIRGGILVLVNMIVYGVIYYPFFKMYEKKMVKQEIEGES